MIYHSKQAVRKFLHTSSIALLCLCISSNLYSDMKDNDQFLRGQDYYHSGDYAAAIKAFTEATIYEPENSVYFHWLGRSYGQQARSASLLKAYSLSNKTREALERAVELDQNNTAAISDLIKYYEQAPTFLGGGPEKAEEMRKRLQELQNNTYSSES